MHLAYVIPPNCMPALWFYFEVTATMSNLGKPKTLICVQRNRDTVKFADSGAFQLLSGEDPATVVNRYFQNAAWAPVDYIMTLDIIPPMGDDPEKYIRIEEKNYAIWRELSKHMWDIVPVVHVHRSTKHFQLALQMYTGVKILAIGGVAAAMRRPQLRRPALEALLTVRDYRPAKWVHILGAGSPSLLAGLNKLGFESADSSAWTTPIADLKLVYFHDGSSTKLWNADVEKLLEYGDWLKKMGFPLPTDNFLERIRSTYYLQVAQAYTLKMFAEGRATPDTWLYRFLVGEEAA